MIKTHIIKAPHSHGWQTRDGLWLYPNHFNEALRKFYTCKNVEKEILKRTGSRWQWAKLPDEFTHYQDMGNGIKVPLGIIDNWDNFIANDTEYPDLEKPMLFGVPLYAEQQKEVDELMTSRVGLSFCPTAGGKSYMLLHMAAQLNKKTLIVVDSSQTFNEMCDKIFEFMNIIPTTIGGKAPSKKTKATQDERITVCMLASLDKAENVYGTILVDECDRSISTDERQKVMLKFSPCFLYGFTGTLLIRNQEETSFEQINAAGEKVKIRISKIMLFYFGNPTSNIVNKNFIPRFHRIRTGYKYYGDLDNNAEFTTMLTDISENDERNKLIAETIDRTIGYSETHKGLVLVNRTEHALALQKYLKCKSYIILGETSKEERKRIVTELEQNPNPCVLIGSAQILSRGFDCSVLQNLYLIYPCRFESFVVQAVWRVLRRHEGKTMANVYDLYDPLVPWLERQSRSRITAYKRNYPKCLIG